jgi:hypothetical protein
MARYGLAQHVFVCADEEYVIVLDVKQDRYFTLDAATTAALVPLLPGWPAAPTAGASPGNRSSRLKRPPHRCSSKVGCWNCRRLPKRRRR